MFPCRLGELVNSFLLVASDSEYALNVLSLVLCCMVLGPQVLLPWPLGTAKRKVESLFSLHPLARNIDLGCLQYLLPTIISHFHFAWYHHWQSHYPVTCRSSQFGLDKVLLYITSIYSIDYEMHTNTMITSFILKVTFKINEFNHPVAC